MGYPSRALRPIDFVTIAPAPHLIILFMLPASSSMIPEASMVGFFNGSEPIFVFISARGVTRELNTTRI